MIVTVVVNIMVPPGVRALKPQTVGTTRAALGDRLAVLRCSGDQVVAAASALALNRDGSCASISCTATSVLHQLLGTVGSAPEPPAVARLIRWLVVAEAPCLCRS